MKSPCVLPTQKQYNLLAYNVLNEEKRLAIKYISFGYT